MKKNKTVQKILVVVLFFVMVCINIFAFTIKINGRTTAEIAHSYPNLFTPADYTFSIWGLIYIMLIAFVFYQLGFYGKNRHVLEDELLYQARIILMITSLLNIGWLIAWHYDYMALSLMFITLLLISLKIFCKIIRTQHLTTSEKIFIKLPFSIYYGWITIAIAANAVTLLVSIRWGGFGIPNVIRTILLLIFLTSVVIFRAIRNKDLIYCITVLWGYTGVLVKHLEKDGFNGQYPQIIGVTTLGMVILAGVVPYLISNRKREHY